MNIKGTSYLDCSTCAPSPVFSVGCWGRWSRVVNPVVTIRASIRKGG